MPKAAYSGSSRLPNTHTNPAGRISTHTNSGGLCDLSGGHPEGEEEAGSIITVKHGSNLVLDGVRGGRLTRGSQKSDKRTHWPKTLESFFFFLRFSRLHFGERERKQRKPLELESDCYYFHTAWWVGGCKRRGGRRSEGRGVLLLLRGACGFLSPTPSHPLSLLSPAILSLIHYTSSCQRMRGKENSPSLTKLCQNGSGKNKTCRHANGGKKNGAGFDQNMTKLQWTSKKGLAVGSVHVFVTSRAVGDYRYSPLMESRQTPPSSIQEINV